MVDFASKIILNDITLADFFVNADAVAEPKCTANLSELGVVDEFQKIDIQCTVTFNGKWVPAFHCLPETQTASINHSSEVKSSPLVRVVTYSHPVRVTQPLHNTSLTCTMTYGSKESMALATPPTSNFVWKTVPLFVTCEY